ASNSHKAIHNLLDQVVKIAKPFVGLKKCSADNPESEYHGKYFSNSENIDDFVPAPVSSRAAVSAANGRRGIPSPQAPQLIAGTSWLFADPRLDQTLDYLFIDEAGQVALANALVMAMAAKRV